MSTGRDKLQFNSAASRMDIPEDVWKPALDKAEEDPVVHIKHAALDGDENQRNHVALIPDRVGCHVHFQEEEVYEVVSGQGRLHWAMVDSYSGAIEGWGEDGAVFSGEYDIIQQEPIDVKTGDSFILPPGCVHQLQSTSDEPLVITFGCPDSHLDDSVDRTNFADLAPSV